MRTIGETAPEFSLPDQNGELHRLQDYRGQLVLLYFYPKDDTPGCTKEACTIADLHDEFDRRRIKVLGVSADDQASHRAFAEKYRLPFTLLSDTDQAVIKAYGAYKGADAGGRVPIARVSYLIDEEGRILEAYPEVDPATHAAEILKRVSAYQPARGEDTPS